MRLLSLARDLQRRKGRERRGLFIAEGVRAVEEVVRARVRIVGVLLTPQIDESGRGRTLRQALERRADAMAEVSPRDLASAAGTDTPQGVLAVAELPAYSLDELRLREQARILVLDGVQDPGNVGTILRTAAAFGTAATIALPGTVDVWNPKVVRGGMGAHFRAPVIHAEAEQLFSFLDASHTELWVAEAAGEPLDRTAPPRRLAIVIGNEGAGVSAPVRARAHVRMGLQLSAGVESLNVAVATGILLYALRLPEET